MLRPSGIAFYKNRREASLRLSLPRMGKGDRASGARVLASIACLKRISPLSFIPPVPYPPLRGTFPSRGRLCVGDSGILVSQPSPLGKAVCRGYRFPPPTSAPSGHLLPKEGGSIHASPFPWKGLLSAARRGWLPFLRRSRLLFTFPSGEGGPRSGG